MFKVTPITVVVNASTVELSNEGKQQVCVVIADKVRQKHDQIASEGKVPPFTYCQWWWYRDNIEDWSVVNKQGRINVRLSKYLKEHGVELDEKAWNDINGTIAAHSYRKDVIYDITDDFSWNSGDFGDAGSCFWGSNEAARDVLMENGALALRFYEKTDRMGWYHASVDGVYYKGIGRCWIVQKKHGWILFNAYGPELESIRERVRIIFPNCETKMIRIQNERETTGLVYINRDGLGLYVTDKPEEVPNLLAREEYSDNHHAIQLGLNTESHTGRRCHECGERDEEGWWIDDNWVCHNCYDDHYFCCSYCGDNRRNYEANELTMWTRWYSGSVKHNTLVCESCLDYHSQCSDCETWVNDRDAYHYITCDTKGGESVCNMCIKSNYFKCEECEIYIKEDEVCSCQPKLLELEQEAELQ